MILDDDLHGFNGHIDLVGSGSDEDIEMFLRYYADASHRQQWLLDWSKDMMPETKPLPYDRDRLLPKPE